ncbi:MAG: helix-turn-helix transcriptional regulator [Muribaculaceae bacterium]|nr:helix-turn-helix transcriptional regulator [Muribaculaceae bacterium]
MVPLLWLIVCYFIYKQQNGIKKIVDNDYIHSIDENGDEEVGGKCADDSIDQIFQHCNFESSLKELFEKDKIYLNATLTLSDLAKLLNTNRTYISTYLNNILSTTFCDYVNEYRLEYASKLLLEDVNASLEIIAEMSGFNSLTTFRRAFIKNFRCTPKEYRSSNKMII